MMQPTCMPWQGYFALIYACDCFVFGDDYQFSAGSYHQRNRLFRNTGEVVWMTIPVQKKHSRGLPLNQARICDDPPWREKTWKQVRHNYATAPFFEQLGPLLRQWILTPEESLAAHNIAFIRLACELMGIRREFRLSSRHPSGLSRSQRVVDLIRWCAADVYLCARGSFGYMQADGVFPAPGIDVRFQDFQPQPYPQVGARGTFVPFLSVLDALCNVGPQATRELLAAGTAAWRTWDEMLAADGSGGFEKDEPCQENA
ncbi:MAG: WbqC family protein [Thermoguttaceae bacterium]|jgi:hypothetical protein